MLEAALPLFITAINTGSGKTLISAIICEALQADYWKPIQAGKEEIDKETIASLMTNEKTKIHPERYVFEAAASPHAASKLEEVSIRLHDFDLPKTKNQLVIEGAGGVLVPLNLRGDYIIDIARKFEAQAIIVSNLYLGSINHTLLTINELKRLGVEIKGIIFNGVSTPDSEEIILKVSGLPCLLHVDQEPVINKEIVKNYAAKFRMF